MHPRTRRFIPLPTLILASLLTNAAALAQSTPYTWAPVNPALSTARADACGAALADGTAMISGGVTTDGSVLASVESFQANAGFSLSRPLNVARAAHSCTTLQDRRVLVVGGNDGQGNATGTAEIFDPSSQTWTVVADLNEPRWGHAAVLLANGNVLIAGGQDTYGPKDTLEMFDAATVSFVPLDGRLSTPRTNFAAALLLDGLVAIMGGSNGALSLSSVDIYDPDEDIIIAGAQLLAARASLSANVLLDGTVLVAGGFDGSKDLDSAELYDVHKGSVLAIGNLTTARHGHIGITLPNNGNVLIMAGVSSGAGLATCELYNFPQGGFNVVGSLATPRARTTAVPVGDGTILSAGGVSTDGLTPIDKSGVFTLPTLKFDLIGASEPYTAGLTINGQNFGQTAGVPVTLTLAIANLSGSHSQSITAGASVRGPNFNFVSNGLSPAGNSGFWILTASAAGLQASVIHPEVFANLRLMNSPACQPCNFGDTISLQALVVNPDFSIFNQAIGSADQVVFLEGLNIVKSVPLTSAASGFGQVLTSLTLPPGVHQLIASIGGNSDGYVGSSPQLQITVNPIPTSISLSANPSPALTSSTVKLQASLSFNTTLAASLGKTPTGIVTFKLGTQVLQTATVSGSANPIVLQISVPAPAAGLYSLTAVYGGSSSYASSTSPAVALAVNTKTAAPILPFIGVVNSSGTWFLRNTLSGGPPSLAFVFGVPGSQPVTGDFTGSGHSTVGLFDPASAMWRLGGTPSAPTSQLNSFVFGVPGFKPVVGDWTGAGKDGIGFFEPATATWFLRNSNSAGPADAGTFAFGPPGATPVVGDWDGNGTTTIGVVDAATGTWFLRNENSSGAPDAGTFVFGLPGGIPVTGHWNGTQKTGIGMYIPATGTWILKNSPSAGPPDFVFQFGAPGFLPVTGKQ